MCDITGCGRQPDTPAPKPTDAQRRAFLAGMGSLPLAMVLADPLLAQSAGAGLTPVETATPAGNVARGVLAVPAVTPAPAVLLIHEWWGLNDQIKAVAAEYANQGYIALAVDLYDGQVGTTRDEARALVGSIDAAKATDQLSTLLSFLQDHELSTGKVGTVGWCFGGGWSLNTALAASPAATVIYYGRVNKSAHDLRTLTAPVLGHFGTLDQGIPVSMVEEFQAAAAEAGKSDLLTIHFYEADHAFANPTGSRYDAEDAALAWERTTAFFETHLKT